MGASPLSGRHSWGTSFREAASDEISKSTSCVNFGSKLKAVVSFSNLHSNVCSCMISSFTGAREERKDVRGGGEIKEERKGIGRSNEETYVDAARLPSGNEFG